jgi:tetratricopeptide (TPR) repeat protein
VGEPGIGKTSLVDAFVRQAATHPEVTVARGQSVEGFGSKEAYYPILEALGQLIRGHAGPGVVQTLARHAPTWMVQFASLIQTDQQAALQRELLGATRERMVRELCEALEVLTEAAALVLVLEDLHWVDPSTLDLISAVARRREQAKLLVVGTFRPADVIVSESPLKALKHDLMLHRLSREVELERLREADIADYLAAEFAGSDLPRGLAGVIHRHSDGNPLFMTAMLDHLVQQGVLAGANGRWRLLVPLEEIDPGVPETLRQMLEMQLQHLTEGERQLLKCASVAGHHFTAWSAATMLDADLADIEDKCQALAEGQQFLKSSGARELFGGALTLEYEFRHSLYREVLYRGLSPTERVSLHRRLAGGLEGLRTPVEPEMAAEIALHFEEGREYERAVRYLVMAGENATRRHAYRESIEVLEHARALLPRIPGARGQELELHILERIGDAHYTLGDVQRSLDTYDFMAVGAAEAGLPAAEASALMRLAHPAAFVDPERCVAGCERAARLGAVTGDGLLETHATLLAACWRIMIDGWRAEDAAACAASMATLRQLGGDLPPYDQILYARVQVLQSEYAEACQSTDQALLKLTEAHGLWVRAKTLSTKATALLLWGRLGDAHRTANEGIELAKRNENAPWLGILISTLAWLRWEVYDFDGVQVLAIDGEQCGAFTPELQVRLRAPTNVARKMVQVVQGFTHIAMGRYDCAHRSFEEVRDQPAHPKAGLAWYRRLFARWGLVETWFASGDLARAQAEADALVENVSACGDQYLKARVWEMMARLALAREDWHRAEQCVRRGLEAVTASDVPLAAWRVHATASDVFRRSDSSRADAHRSRARSIILALADSLQDVEPLRRSLLDAAPVRHVLDDDAAGRRAEDVRAPTGTVPV